jgi:hypothetical protein
MAAACDLVGVELGLDRIEAELARELPAHMRMFAHAYARGAAPPPAPAVVHRPLTLATARAALAHPLLADRGLALVRLVAPIALEDDAGVAAARAAPPTWDALARLATARDAAAGARFGRRALDVIHRVHGAWDAAAPTVADLPPAVAGWTAADGVAIDDAGLRAAWAALAARHAVTGEVEIARATGARPRTFVVEPGRAVIVVVPAALAAPADRFAVLHELGHALAALLSPAGLPRVLDEAVAAYAARDLERADHPWHAASAAPARARRRQLAGALDRCERALPTLDPPSARIAARPPWALWHDPGAQAAYVAAEPLADALAAASPGALAAAIAAQRAAIDRRDTGLI